MKNHVWHINCCISASILFLSLFTPGCTTPHKDLSYEKKQYKRLQAQWKPIETAATTAAGARAAGGAPPPGTATQDEINVRIQQVKALEVQLDTLEANWDGYVRIAGQAILYANNLRTWTSIGGAAASITSIGLTTASPANKVWAVIFTGLAGSSASTGLFNTAASTTSSLKALQGEQNIISKHDAALQNIKLGTLFATAQDPATTYAVWGPALDTQRAAINALKTVLDNAQISIDDPTGQ